MAVTPMTEAQARNSRGCGTSRVRSRMIWRIVPIGQSTTKKYAKETTRPYSSSYDSHFKPMSAVRNATFNGGLASESISNCLHVHTAKMLDDVP
eukprot:2934885-Prymnesium_polylepis.2